MSGIVGAYLEEMEWRAGAQLPDQFFLTGTDLHHQPGPGAQAEQLLEESWVESVALGAGEESRVGLEVENLSRQRGGLVSADIRRIADDEIETGQGQTSSQVASREQQSVLQPVATKILQSDSQGSGRDVGGDNPGCREFQAQGAGEAAGTGSDIEHRGRWGQRQLEHPFDEVLGLGSRDEHPAVDLERPAVELLAPDDIGNRLTAEPAVEDLFETAGGSLFQCVVLPGENLRLRPFQDVAEQENGLTGIGLKRRLGESLPSVGQGLAYDGLHSGSVSNAIEAGVSAKAFSGGGSVEALRAQAVAVFEAGVRAADPRRAVMDGLRRTSTGRPVIGREALHEDGELRVVAFGKAAVTMARAAAESLSSEEFAGPGIVVVNPENAAELDRFQVFASSHPVPDAIGVAAGAAVEAYLANSHDLDALLVLISGGGSALLPSPAPGVSLEDKIEATRLLLACGAPIQEVNCVRKHLSTLKGGGLARLASPARIEALILSDVIGDDLSSIASGPTAPDPTSFQDALDILVRYELRESIPAAVRRRFEQGVAGQIADTPAAGDPVFSRVENRLVGSNRQSLSAARDWAREQGFEVVIASSELLGEARDAAAELLAFGRQQWDGERRMAILAGGETTVTLRGEGLGGRNQETALAFSLLCEANPLSGSWAFLSGGTDGRDGPTDAAGGLVDAGTPQRIRHSGLDPTAELDRNNSYVALAAAADLLMTGATGTNVADLQFLLLVPDSSAR